ncbi:hypothetical protein [Lactococcus fujiensis]|nr:hypothetical protein [Lactococcus fujiensis]
MKLKTVPTKTSVEINEFIVDVDLSQREKSKKIENLINEDFKTLGELYCLFEEKRNSLQGIISEETPIELELIPEPLNPIWLEKLDDYTPVVRFSNGEFYPISDYSSVDELSDVLNGKNFYDDLNKEREFSYDGKYENAYGSAILVPIEGWYPERSLPFMREFLEDAMDIIEKSLGKHLTMKFLLQWSKDNNFDYFEEDDNEDNFDFKETTLDFLEQLNYFGFVKLVEDIAETANGRISKHYFRAAQWCGYSQGEGGLILYEGFQETPETMDSYYESIAAGDSYFKQIK